MKMAEKMVIGQRKPSYWRKTRCHYIHAQVYRAKKTYKLRIRKQLKEMCDGRRDFDDLTISPISYGYLT
jgi:hypothetical protein